MSPYAKSQDDPRISAFSTARMKHQRQRWLPAGAGTHRDLKTSNLKASSAGPLSAQRDAFKTSRTTSTGRDIHPRRAPMLAGVR